MKRKYLLLFLIVIIASFMRLSNITTIPNGLYPDEAMNGNNALEAIETGNFKVFYPENNGREGLFINIQSLFIRAFGNQPWALRIPSAIFGILTVLGIYFLAKELFKGNEKIALLSSFLAATGFWHIVFSRIGFRAIMAPFFMVWASYLLLLALRKYEINKKIILLISLSAIGGILLGLGFHSYIAYRIMPLVFVSLIPFFFRKKEFYVAGFTFLIFTTISILPLATHFIKVPEDFLGRTTQVSVFSSDAPIKDLAVNTLKTAAMFNFAGDYNWRHNISGKPELFWPVGIFFIIGIIAGVKNIFNGIIHKKSEYMMAYVFLFVWFIVAALPVVISNEGIPHALRAILMIPPVFILSGMGGIKIYDFAVKKFKNRKIVKIAAVLFIIILLLEAYNSYFNKWAKNENTLGAFSKNYVDIGKQLNEIGNETRKFVILNAGGVLVRGIPMPSQTVMFITDSFTKEKQEEKNIFYLTKDEAATMEFKNTDFIISID
jgi:4-amino-4-deoxy-L-arabinose transferase-like glycosyltransferase